MKLAILHYATPPVIGGVERIIAAHARLFRARGHDVSVVSCRGAADLVLPTVGSAEAYRAALEPFFATSDRVFAHNVLTMPFNFPLTEAVAQLAARFPGRVVNWVHDIAAVNPDLAPVPDVLRRAIVGVENVAVSAQRAQEFTQLTGASCAVVPNGVDLAETLNLPGEVAAFAQRHGLLDGRTVLLHPTRLLRRKNVELGLELMAAWREQGEAATLLITGAPDPHNPTSAAYGEWLRQERARLQVEPEVVFAGEELPVSDTELAALFRLADALFFPSRHEGFGLPVIEAALHRLPAFVADIPPMNALLSANQRRFPLGRSPAELAKWMRAELTADPSTQARKEALQYNWDRLYDRHLVPLLQELP